MAGHLEAVQWMRAQHPPCPWNDTSCDMAAASGHIEVLQWLLAQDPPYPFSDGIGADAASDAGNHELKQWILSKYNDSNNRLSMQLCSGSQAPVVAYPSSDLCSVSLNTYPIVDEGWV
jgi:hypothetical protein